MRTSRFGLVWQSPGFEEGSMWRGSSQIAPRRLEDCFTAFAKTIFFCFFLYKPDVIAIPRLCAGEAISCFRRKIHVARKFSDSFYQAEDRSLLEQMQLLIGKQRKSHAVMLRHTMLTYGIAMCLGRITFILVPQVMRKLS